MDKDPLFVINRIGQALFDKKGFNILALDLRHVSTMTDFFLIAEGSVDRHVVGLAKEVLRVMKELGEMPIHTEGLKSGDWVVLDFLEIVIHLFMPGLRDKYRLEELWHDGKIIDLDIVVTR